MRYSTGCDIASMIRQKLLFLFDFVIMAMALIISTTIKNPNINESADHNELSSTANI